MNKKQSKINKIRAFQYKASLMEEIRLKIAMKIFIRVNKNLSPHCKINKSLTDST